MSSRVNAIIPAGAGLTRSTRSTAFEECWSTQTTGANAREQSIGTASAIARISAFCRATAFDELADDDAQVGQDRERDHERDAAWEEVEVPRDERLADHTEGDAETVIPTWTVEMKRTGSSISLKRRPGRAPPALRSLLEARPARGDERVLGATKIALPSTSDEHEERAPTSLIAPLYREKVVAPHPGRGYWAGARRPLRPAYR